MPLLDHLVELRKRLIYALISFFLVFFVTFYFAKPIFSFLIQPALQDGYKVIVLDIFEFFFVTVKLSAFVALIVGFPLIAVQIWLFVGPGLYRQEKRAFLPFLIATPFMFYAGCAVMYYIVLPYVINQLALAGPLIAFYEISIIIGGWIEKKRDAEDKKAEEAEEKSGP